MKSITQGVKLILNKTGPIKGSTGFFGKAENITLIKKKIITIINSKNFKNFKVVVETGAGVGGIILFLQHWYDSPLTRSQAEEMLTKAKQEILASLKDQGLMSQEGGVDVEVLNEPKKESGVDVKKVLAENEELRKQHLQNKHTIQTQNSVLIIAGVFLLLALLKPTKALDILEDYFESK